MPIIKCRNCGYEGEGPSDEFCHLCGTALEVAPEVQGPQPPSVASVEHEPSPSQSSAPAPAPAVPAIKAKLVVIQTGRVGQEFAITKDSVDIGRLDPDSGVWPDIDLTQDDPGTQVSRKHARIVFRDGKYFIEDLGSTNGTFVNKGPRLAPGMPQQLRSGDEIIMGRTSLSFLTQ